MAVTGAAAFGAVLNLAATQSYLSVGPAGMVDDFAVLGLAFRWALVVAAILGSTALIVSVAQLTADARFGADFGALALVGAVLSGAIVWSTGQPLLWLAVWFPACAAVAVFCRIVPHAAWLAICCVGIVTLALTAVVTAFAVINGWVEWIGIVRDVLIRG